MSNTLKDKKFPLYQKEAEIRKNLLSKDNGKTYNISYDLILTIRRSTDKLSEEKHDFEGHLISKFDYYPKNDIKDPFLFFNFFGEVHSLLINDNKIDNFEYKDDKLKINLEFLKPDTQNTVEILFSGDYNHNGAGLHHYIDPIDKKEYLYTQMEPFDCNRLFPCFDQPDLKATLSLQVIAPKEWIVLANSFEKEINDFSENKISIKNDESKKHMFLNHDISNKNYHIYNFETSPRISTYLYAICAGPYHCIKNEKYESKVPLRLFMRESLKNYGTPDEIFRVTIAGMNFYKEYFGIEFQFGKYDQIFCPEYNYGAMENVGLITFNEAYCWKNTPTQRQKTFFTITVLHELAHMWFGDFVTMKWWDDLWLNEAFATFISHLCIAKSPELLKDYPLVWELFTERKGPAYSADQLSTTHPVKFEVLNTEIAETAFDTIVYKKGSAILKQMYYYIGDEVFSQGLKNYFKEFGWSNTVFDDFIGKMIEVAGDKLKNFKEICDNWLKKAGLNEISYKLEYDENTKLIKKFVVNQTPCLESFPNLQTQFVDFLFIYDYNDDTKNKILKRQQINASSETEFDFSKELVPKLVFLNYNDYGYMKLGFDKESISNLDGIENFKENQVKQSIYRALFDSVRDGKISALDFINITFKLLEKESKENIVILLSYTDSVISQYIPFKYLVEYKTKFFKLLVKILENELSKFFFSEDVVKQIISFLPRNCTNDEDRKYLIKLLNINSKLISQDNRFSIVKNIFKSRTISLEEKQKLLEKECERDNNSDSSIRARIGCNAALPDKENKLKVWDKLVNEPNKDSLKNRIQLMASFAPYDQIDLVEDLIKNKYFEVFPDLIKNVEHFYLEYFIYYCGPSSYIINEEVIKKYEELKEKIKDNTQATKFILEECDLMKRRLKGQNITENEIKNKQ